MANARAKNALRVQQREVLGKKVKRLRWQGIVPANIYGHGAPSTAIQVQAADLAGLVRTAGRNEIVYLTLDGQAERPTLLRHIQREVLGNGIVHVDFQEISLTETVRLDVPIHLVGVAPAVDAYQGALLHSLQSVSIEGLATDVPSHFEVDVSGLEEIGASLHVRDIAIPPNLTLHTDQDLVIASIASTARERAEAEALAEAPVEVEVETAAGEEGAAEPEAEEAEE